MLFAITDHAAERFRQRVRGTLDAKNEVIAARALLKYGFAYSVIVVGTLGVVALPPPRVYARLWLFVYSPRSSFHQLPW